MSSTAATATAPAAPGAARDRMLPPSAPTPPYPQTARQAEFMALADDLAEFAAERAARHDRDNSFPHEVFRRLRETGYLALTVPEEYGGRGATPLELMLAQERLARGDGSVALASTMHLVIIGGLAESRAWPEPLFERICREVVADGAVINSAASEPDLGSPSRGGAFATLARRTGDGYRLSGHKRWTTLSPVLRYAVVLASVEEEDGSTGRGSFLVPMDAPGVRIEETWDNHGMRATGSHDVVFTDVAVPFDHRLPDNPSRPGAGPAAGGWTIVTSAVYLGLAVAARDFAVAYARDRRPSGLPVPIAELQTVQHRVAQIEILLLQARSTLYAAAQLYADRPEERAAIAPRFAAAKLTTTNHAIAVTDQALRVVGSAGLSRKLPLERYHRDVRAGLGNPPMEDVALTLIGKTALGLNPPPPRPAAATAALGSATTVAGGGSNGAEHDEGSPADSLGDAQSDT